MFRSVIKIGFVGALIAFVAITMAFSSSKLSQVNCDELVIVIDEGSPRFIDEAEIARLVKKVDDQLLQRKLNEINTERLEAELKKVAAIKNIEIFRKVVGDSMDFKGKLLVEVEQRDPILRVVNNKEDFYLDEEGVRIPASQAFTTKVLLVNGEVDEKYAREKLLPMVRFIHEHEFWDAQIEQLMVNSDGEVLMATLIGDQLIEFGKPTNYQTKLRNLKALYEQALPKLGWELYSKINLKYTNQVVCTKK